jgi:hypothetical protein
MLKAQICRKQNGRTGEGMSEFVIWSFASCMNAYKVEDITLPKIAFATSTI